MNRAGRPSPEEVIRRKEELAKKNELKAPDLSKIKVCKLHKIVCEPRPICSDIKCKHYEGHRNEYDTKRIRAGVCYETYGKVIKQAIDDYQGLPKVIKHDKKRLKEATEKLKNQKYKRARLKRKIAQLRQYINTDITDYNSARLFLFGKYWVEAKLIEFGLDSVVSIDAIRKEAGEIKNEIELLPY